MPHSAAASRCCAAAKSEAECGIVAPGPTCRYCKAKVAGAKPAVVRVRATSKLGRREAGGLLMNCIRQHWPRIRQGALAREQRRAVALAAYNRQLTPAVARLEGYTRVALAAEGNGVAVEHIQADGGE